MSMWRPNRIAARVAAQMIADFFTADVLFKYVSIAS